jgi:1-acyl-sn-glycerol-3-phosphate acyltransferase
VRSVFRSAFNWWSIAATTSLMYVVGAPIFLVTAPFDPLRKVGHWYATRWGRILCALNARWSVEVVGVEKIPTDRPLVIVSNHQGIGDIIAVYFLDVQFKWISKAANFYVPFMGWFMFHAGYIPLHRGRKDSIRRTLERARHFLDRGISILFFAEGTRSKDGSVLPFKPGAFKVAIEGGFDILPIGIGGTRDALPKHSWKFPDEETPMKLVVGEIISTKGLDEGDIGELAKRARDIVIRLKADADARIAQQLGRGAAPGATIDATIDASPSSNGVDRGASAMLGTGPSPGR